MTKLLSNGSEVNSYNTRASPRGNITVLNASLNPKKRTFQWRVTQIWNALPVSLRGMITLLFLNIKEPHDLNYIESQ